MRLSIMLVLFAGVCCVGQQVAAKTTPDPAMGGGVVTLTIQATSGTVHLPSSQGYTSVRQGSPTGPIVPGGSFWLPVIVTLAPCMTYAPTWIAPAVLLPETFWFEVMYFDANWIQHTEFFPVTVNVVAGPVLNEFFPAQRGAWWQLALGAPSLPGSPYVAAISFTTNTGIAAPGIGFIALDNDLLFQLSLANALPTASTNMQGILGMGGASAPITIFIPQVPQLACMPLHMQAAVMGASGTVFLTQCHDTWIL